ncbi:MAG: hypothetical protein ACI9FU_000451 [Granulosicoccus sp.]|jgi:hypothetical protein
MDSPLLAILRTPSWFISRQAGELKSIMEDIPISDSFNLKHKKSPMKIIGLKLFRTVDSYKSAETPFAI